MSNINPNTSSKSSSIVGDAVRADIFYLKPDPLYDEEKPYSLASDPPPGIKKTNIVNIPAPAVVQNARGNESQFSLYANGFEWAKHDLDNDLGFGKDETQLDRYMEEMGRFLRSRLKAFKVVVYDYVIRWQREPQESRPDEASKKVKRHILGAHLDIGRASAETRIRLKCGDEAEDLLKRRWHIVNIWRPLQEPVKSMPLALCDSKTLHEDDLVASDIIYPHLELEAYELWYNPNHSWYYLKDQMINEVLMIMNMDSGSATRCAHTAFNDPNTPPDAPRRRSIELRCMVFL